MGDSAISLRGSIFNGPVPQGFNALVEKAITVPIVGLSMNPVCICSAYLYTRATRMANANAA
jgi:hypothetical protein